MKNISDNKLFIYIITVNKLLYILFFKHFFLFPTHHIILKKRIFIWIFRK